MREISTISGSENQGSSRQHKKDRFLARGGYFVIGLLCAAASIASAQYYDDREYEPPANRYLNGGFMQRDFQPRSSNPNPDSLAISYDHAMPMIGLRQGNVDISFGYTGYTLNGRSRSTIFFGASFVNEFPITGRARTGLLIPAVISVDYTKAESAGPSRENFNIASGGIGTGLKLRHRASNLDFWLQAVEIIHFSTEGFGAGYGFSAATVGEAVLLLPRALVFDGIVLGYRFRLQTWVLNESRFNYRSLAHGPFIGVLF